MTEAPAPPSRRTLHLVIPGPLDQATGGYIYDRRIVEGLTGLGWEVVVHSLDGRFPDVDDAGRSSMAATLAAIPDGSAVVLDGLASGGVPEVVEPHSGRLALVGLVHHPLADETGLDPAQRECFELLERRTLAACRGVVATSTFTARRLREGYGVDPARLRVVEPGCDPAPFAAGPPAGAPPHLLCVGSVTRRKGHDVLLRALETLRDRPWSCTCAGSLRRDPGWADSILDRVREAGLDGRMHFPGEVDAAALEALYAGASLLVLPSHFEGYGMVLAEALARGLPVVSTTGGAIPGTVPPEAGLLVPPGDPAALAAALGSLLPATGPDDDPRAEARRAALVRGARARAATLPRWDESAGAFERALAELIPGALPPAPPPGGTFSGDWLALREPVDHRSRPPSLAERLREAWKAKGWREVVDLGSGTGSNLRYLAPRIPGAQRWTLVDHDPALLARVGLVGLPGVEVTPRVGDLAGPVLDAIDGADLVTASALLDLVTGEWLAEVVQRCRRRGAALLLALSYDGSVRWEGPAPDPDDPAVLEAVNTHQLRDKGLGGALGPEGGRVAAELLRTAGYRVLEEPSPWVLGPADAALARALVEGWAEAAAEERPAEIPRFRDWARRRLAAVDDPGFRLVVGHLDLLALPPEEA